jgi:hypothetical protein
MEIIEVTNKRPVMDTTEKYHIYIAYQNGIQLHGTHTHNRNPIFDTLYTYHQTEYATPHSTAHNQPDTSTQRMNTQ